MKRLGGWRILIGAAVSTAVVILGIWLAVNGFRQVMGVQDDAVPVGGAGNSVAVHWAGGQKVALYTYGANGVYVGPIPQCSITGPAPLRPGGAVTSSVTVGPNSRISFASYVVVVPGTYRVTCDTPGVTIAPPLSATGMVGGIGGIFLAIIGAAVLVIALARWVSVLSSHR